MKQPLSVSVVIPARNEEDYIGACLKALIGQLGPKDEVIVVDNNSTDQTARLVSAYPQVRLLQQPIIGRIAAQQLGFEAAKCPIIARIDADSIVQAGWLERLRNHFSNPAVIAISGLGEPYDVVLSRTFKIGMNFWLSKVERLLAGSNVTWGSNCAFRSQAWQALGTQTQFNPDVHEDFGLSLLLARSGQIIYDPKLLVSFSNRLMRPTSKQMFIYPIMSVRTYWRANHKLSAMIYLPFWLLSILAISPLIILEEVLRFVRQQPLRGSLRALLSFRQD